MDNTSHKTQHIIVDHLNAQSLLGNFNQIEFMLRSKSIDILCISESWLLPELDSSFADIYGYYLYRCDGGRGGGVCIYVRETLKVTVLTPQEIVRPLHIEDLWIVVQYKKFPSFIIGCVYRHPHAIIDSFDYI